MYVVTQAMPKTKQISFEDWLLNDIPEEWFEAPSFRTTNTITRITNHVSETVCQRERFTRFRAALDEWMLKYEHLYAVANRHELYHEFKIPKKTHGYRQICAPNTELMEALRELKEIMEELMPVNYHTSAFAYIKGRSTVDCVKRHRDAKSNWFLKTDFSNFFGSTTMEFLKAQLETIFPFSEVFGDPETSVIMERALDLCFLDGGLPQGTPISPMLTNLMMIPFDHRVCNAIAKQGFTYTRYADDIQISRIKSFMFKDMVSYLNETCAEFGAPFQIKSEKTHYGSKAGANWMLGLMLNKDDEITVGRREKENLRQQAYHFSTDFKAGNPWPIEDTQYLAGRISYLRQVEPKYCAGWEGYISRTYGLDFMGAIKAVIKGVA